MATFEERAERIAALREHSEERTRKHTSAWRELERYNTALKSNVRSTKIAWTRADKGPIFGWGPSTDSHKVETVRFWSMTSGGVIWPVTAEEAAGVLARMDDIIEAVEEHLKR